MKNRIKLTLVLLTLLSLASCGKERLTVHYQELTVNQLTNERPVKFSYHTEDTQIDEYGKNSGKFPIFGVFFKAIFKAFANAAIGKDGVQLDLPATTLDLSSVLKIDLNTVDWITLDQLAVTIKDPKSKDNLRFLDKVEIFVKLKTPIDGVPVDQNGFSRLLYYDRVEKKLSCNDKCAALKSEDIDWKKFLQENKIVEIKPLITINSVPESTMKVAGLIKFSVKFNVGF